MTMEQDYRNASIDELRAQGQKTAPNPEKETNVGKFSRFFSIYATWLFLRTSFTPNQISVLGCVIYVAGFLVLFHPSYAVRLLAPFLYFLSIVVDGSDGEVARIKKNGNKYGGPYVEPVTHDNLYSLTMILSGYVVSLQTGNYLYTTLGFGGALAKTLYRLIRLRFWNVVYKDTDYAAKEVQNLAAAGRSPLRKLFDFINGSLFTYTGMFLPFTVAVILNRLDYFVVAYGVGFTILYVLLLAKHSYQIARS